MSTPIDDGGPAFPTPDIHHPNGQIQFWSNGMTKREYMAIHAPQRAIDLELGTTSIAIGSDRAAHENKARYQWADAMIKAGKPSFDQVRSLVIPKEPTPEILAVMLRAFTTCDIDEVLSGRYTITNNVETVYKALVKEVSE